MPGEEPGFMMVLTSTTLAATLPAPLKVMLVKARVREGDLAGLQAFRV